MDELVIAAGKEFEQIAVVVNQLANMMDSLVLQFIQMQKACIWPIDDVVKQYLDHQALAFSGFNQSVASIIDAVSPHKHWVMNSEYAVKQSEFWIYQIPMVPMYLMVLQGLVCVIFVVMISCCKAKQGFSGAAGHCVIQQFLTGMACCNYGAVVFAGWMWFFCIMLSAFCRHPDANLLNFVYSGGVGNFAARPIDSLLANYYIADHAPNPILQELYNGEQQLHTLRNEYNNIKWVMDPVQWVCKSVDLQKDIGVLLDVPLELVKDLQESFHPRNVWPGWKATRDIMCTDAPFSGGMVAIFTSLVAAICLPLMTGLTGIHLGVWKQSKLLGEAEDLLEDPFDEDYDEDE
jgi:hypothetical protein